MKSTPVEAGGTPRDLSPRLVVLLAALLAVAIVSWLAPGLGPIVAPPAMAVGYGVAGWLISREGGRRRDDESPAWRLVGAGLISGSVGVVLLAVVTLVDPNAPAFGPVDVFFLGAYALIVAGLWRLPHVARDAASRYRVFLDGLIGGVSLAALLWVTVDLGSLVEWGNTTSPWTIVIGSLYPLLDLAAFVAVMIVVVRRSSLRFDIRLVFLAAGILLQATADIIYLHESHDLAVVGSPAFLEIQPPFAIFLLAACSFIVTGALIHRRPAPREFADRTAPWWTLIAPYSTAVLLVILLMVEVTQQQLTETTTALLYATLVVGALVVIRQTIAIRENRALVERQRAALVSSISHELRTPLTAMVGFLEVMDEMADDLSPDDKQEMMGVVRQQASYMTRIVTDLVMLARGSLDQMDLHRAPEDVTRIAYAAVASVEGGADGTEVVAPDHLVARVDADRIQQAVVNLITNAIRYGGSRRIVRMNDEGGNLAIEVHDDGPGVPKKFELTIWERFERGPNRLNATVPGSGIGLAVVDAIARSHGGTARYRPSELLGGACFSITVPDAVVAAGSLTEASPVGNVVG